MTAFFNLFSLSGLKGIGGGKYYGVRLWCTNCLRNVPVAIAKGTTVRAVCEQGSCPKCHCKGFLSKGSPIPW